MKHVNSPLPAIPIYYVKTRYCSMVSETSMGDQCSSTNVLTGH